VFGIVPDSSTSLPGFEVQQRDYLRNFLLNDELNEVPGTPRFVKELLSRRNRLFLWSKVSIFPNNLSVPDDISLHIFATDAVEKLRFEDIYGLVIHRSPQSRELSISEKQFLSSLFQEDLKNLKVLVFLDVFLEHDLLPRSIYSSKFSLLCLVNCIFVNSGFLEWFESVDELYLTPSGGTMGPTYLPPSLKRLEIFCPKPERGADPVVCYSVSAINCQALGTA
jgi:hypothetical protein